MKDVNEEWDGVRFDYAFKADSYIVSIVSRTNERIRWIFKHFILWMANVVLKMYGIQMLF